MKLTKPIASLIATFLAAPAMAGDGAPDILCTFKPEALSPVYKGPPIEDVVYHGYYDSHGELCFGQDCIESIDGTVKLLMNHPRRGKLTLVSDHIQKTDEPIARNADPLTRMFLGAAKQEIKHLAPGVEVEIVVDTSTGKATLAGQTGLFTITNFAGYINLTGECNMFTDPS